MKKQISLVLDRINWEILEDRVSKLDKKFSSDSVVFSEKSVQERREYAFLSDMVEKYSALCSYDDELHSVINEYEKELDENIKSLLLDEKNRLSQLIIDSKDDLEKFIFVDDREVFGDENNEIFLEIRIGTGGQESSLFCADLARLYKMYANKHGWAISVASCSETEIGGIREIVLHIEGKSAVASLSHEAGVHRVQRVPETEGSGRVHTSTATVAVLPVINEVEISINPIDLKIDTYRAGGAGGQHVNKTDSAIRITHIPSGIVVCCQDERSQHKNRSKAMKVLQAKLSLLEKEKQRETIGKMRKEMVANADRADKIRTYNFPQNRVTDHRIPITLNNLDYIIEGNLDELIEALQSFFRKERVIHPFVAPFYDNPS